MVLIVSTKQQFTTLWTTSQSVEGRAESFCSWETHSAQHHFGRESAVAHSTSWWCPAVSRLGKGWRSCQWRFPHSSSQKSQVESRSSEDDWGNNVWFHIVAGCSRVLPAEFRVAAMCWKTFSMRSSAVCVRDWPSWLRFEDTPHRHSGVTSSTSLCQSLPLRRWGASCWWWLPTTLRMAFCVLSLKTLMVWMVLSCCGCLLFWFWFDHGCVVFVCVCVFDRQSGIAMLHDPFWFLQTPKVECGGDCVLLCGWHWILMVLMDCDCDMMWHRMMGKWTQETKQWWCETASFVSLGILVSGKQEQKAWWCWCCCLGFGWCGFCENEARWKREKWWFCELLIGESENGGFCCGFCLEWLSDCFW